MGGELGTGPRAGSCAVDKTLLTPQVSDSSVSSVEPSLSASTLRARWRGLQGEPTRGGVRGGRQLPSGPAVTEVTRPGICASLKKGRHPRERGASCPETRTPHSLWRVSETTGCLPKGFKERPPRASAGPQPLRPTDRCCVARVGSDPTEVWCPQGGSIFPPNTYSRSSSSSMAGSCIRSPLSGKAPRK